MSIFAKLKALAADPPPEFIFEVSEAGLAWVRTADPANLRSSAFEPGTLLVSPLEDNIKNAADFAAARAQVRPGHGQAQPPARGPRSSLPDFCARVAVLDFDTFPSDPAEQLQLARFRAKRAVPFDIDAAQIACYPQPRTGKKIDVVVAVINMEVAAHYQAPFRAAGFHCGVVTISALAALSLAGEAGHEQASPSVTAKLSGNVLALSLVEGRTLRVFRCVQLHGAFTDEATDVLATTFAYAEDELGARPQVLRLCGVPRELGGLRQRWADELGLPVTGVTSRFGVPTPTNAGLLGYMEAAEVG